MKKERAEKERRRQAAFKEKEWELGAKPTGVEKNKEACTEDEGFGLSFGQAEWSVEGGLRGCEGEMPRC